MLKLTRPLAFIDLETTGINLGSDRIVEIGMIKVLPDGNRSAKRKLLNPEIPIPVSSSDIHGITNEMVKDAPTFKQAAPDIRQFLDNCDLSGYNSNRFDIPMLMEEFLRADVEFDMKGRKLVSDYLIDIKASQKEKENQYVLLSGGRIAWLVGRRIDDFFKIEGNTSRVLCVSIS